jgi:hypothetical protein
MNYIALKFDGIEVEAPSSIQHLQDTGPFAENVIQYGIVMLFVIAITLTLIYILWAAIDWIMSEGDKTKIQMHEINSPMP